MNDSRYGGTDAPETVVFGRTGDDAAEPGDTACVVEEPLDPATIVIFGASGDLTERKLIPALYNLFVNDGLPKPFAIVGCARTEMSREAFRSRMEDGVRDSKGFDRSIWDRFASSLHYFRLDYDDPVRYKELSAYLDEIDGKYHTRGNRIFYLAVPPSVYETAASMLGTAGLSKENEEGRGWSRIVVEKPFGRDLKTSAELDRTLLDNFLENQIYRIDHYLAKETVQNLMVFRFGNAIFEPLWNRRYIDYIGILAAESLGVEHRARYYEESGVLRDMFQNHMMQLLSLIAMEPPSRFRDDHVRDERAKVFRSLKPLDPSDYEDSLILGQYDAGTIDGAPVPGYRQEPGVDPESSTPTFAAMRVFLSNWRWQGVPFYMVSGKRMNRKLTQIVIQFREVPHLMFEEVWGKRITANRLVIGIQPSEKVTLTFQTKTPGPFVCPRSVTMDFDYYDNYEGPILDAYEKALSDCLQGDHMLFLRQDAVELCWSFLTPIIRECEDPVRCRRLIHLYPAGSWGPDAAEKWTAAIRQGY